MAVGRSVGIAPSGMNPTTVGWLVGRSMEATNVISGTILRKGKKEGRRRKKIAFDQIFFAATRDRWEKQV